MKTSADYFKRSTNFNLLREMDRIANFLEYGIMHRSIEKFARFVIKSNPLKNREEKELFLERSDRQLEYFSEMSKKTSGQCRKLIADDMVEALKSIFKGTNFDNDLEKLFSVEKVKRKNIKKVSHIEDYFTYQVVINLPNFYTVNRNRDYNLESMNLFSSKFITMIEAILGTKFQDSEKSKISKQYLIAEIDSFDDRKTLAKFEYILDGIVDRQREIKSAMIEMFNSLYIAQQQGNSQKLVFA
jgi:hypothetical protein